MKLVILDRDGVINHDSDAFIRSVDEWRPIEGSIDAIARLTQAGYTIAVATNQSGIARGYLSLATLQAIHRRMEEAVTEAGGAIAHIAYCPHGPDDDCACRKPLPGMIDEILDRLGAQHIGERWLVGDSLRDLEAGVSRGFRPVLVRTGKGVKTEMDRSSLPKNTLIFDDLARFAEHVIAEGGA
jgi:D-glycero-D-manno-heptose 1,7-bisphosphate phosphatase